ncbi:hypothetical protein HGM15179_001344 [Zosterops borbonicus]|uniref:Uncharacterized protein n=1 Tax=Zosterops borbonicus TaxID=364589 RepID=A0A8K1LU53_9PASS|nr:hypothetical protein HGM15179_001344 [Zosterops borbonicus]
MGLLLAKDEPVRDGNNASGVTDLSKETILLHNGKLQPEREVRIYKTALQMPSCGRSIEQLWWGSGINPPQIG